MSDGVDLQLFHHLGTILYISNIFLKYIYTSNCNLLTLLVTLLAGSHSNNYLDMLDNQNKFKKKYQHMSKFTPLQKSNITEVGISTSMYAGVGNLPYFTAFYFYDPYSNYFFLVQQSTYQSHPVW